MPNLRRLFAAGLLLIGGLLAVLIALSFPELPLSSCTDVGYSGDEPPGGFEYYEFYLGWIGYSPDGGVNRCDTPSVTIAGGCISLGSVILALDRRKR
ncbi:hypothetical protein [Natronorubrum thiooxidans]|uniref:Uncharacterized protein n=1 Tax=Natronorubrum thiooxidans TaxID=308853 RepID=A0A1N7G156_9EURY|nr:hypothetical protein [Natronorubrum thiooxidans]SIS06322.1 hypothetical protein SAMN05421752_109102 [Natronorubrum thiooxidans]